MNELQYGRRKNRIFPIFQNYFENIFKNTEEKAKIIQIHVQYLPELI